MGASISQVQSPQTSGGKGSVTQAPRGMEDAAVLKMPVFDNNIKNDPMLANVSPAVNKPDLSVNTFPGPNFQQPQGKGGASTNSATSGQPRMGQPNNYANTVGGWDNASIQPQRSGGKGKG